jgi:hypothetical protein
MAFVTMPWCDTDMALLIAGRVPPRRRESPLLFLSEYRFRPGMTKADTAALMTLFGERGPEPGTIAHYVKAGGGGGLVISDQDDAAQAFASSLAYSEFLEFTVTPLLTIDDAVGPIASYLG